jgi:hypothetical protein
MNNSKYSKKDVNIIINKWASFVEEMKVASGVLSLPVGLSTYKMYEGIVLEFDYDLRYRAMIEDLLTNNLLDKKQISYVASLDNDFIKNTTEINKKYWNIKNLPEKFASRIPCNVDDDFKKAIGEYKIILD